MRHCINNDVITLLKVNNANIFKATSSFLPFKTQESTYLTRFSFSIKNPVIILKPVTRCHSRPFVISKLVLKVRT